MMKYKVISTNLDNLTEKKLEKMLEDAYNDGYTAAKNEFLSTLNYTNMPSNSCTKTITLENYV